MRVLKGRVRAFRRRNVIRPVYTKKDYSGTYIISGNTMYRLVRTADDVSIGDAVAWPTTTLKPGGRLYGFGTYHVEPPDGSR